MPDSWVWRGVPPQVVEALLRYSSVRVERRTEVALDTLIAGAPPIVVRLVVLPVVTTRVTPS